MDKEKDNIQNKLNSSVEILKGIGPKKALLLNKLGIYSVWDLMYYFPRTYEDRRKVCRISECVPNEYCCIKIRPVRQVVEKKIRSKLSLFILRATDGYDPVTVKWFSASFSKPRLKAGVLYMVYGKAVSSGSGYEFELKFMEEADKLSNTRRIVPIYHATTGLTTKTISEYVKSALNYADFLNDCIPDNLKSKYSLLNIKEAIVRIHLPNDETDIKAAHKRLAFEELFVLSIALRCLKNKRLANVGYIINNAAESMRSFAATLPFELTDGQKKALNEICADFLGGKQMNRLVQGDVGCGKTAVAAVAIKAVCAAGYQSVFMAPTEILAVQHFETLKKMYGDDIKITLLTSSTKKKNEVLQKIKDGEFGLVVGTHAVIEKNVEFANLALCITDEQHRFGVNQRAVLSSKGKNSQLMVMSATPIPRTLSLILYGDLNVSVIKSMPKLKASTETYHITSSKLDRAYQFIYRQVSIGRQCYIVCPLVEESEFSAELSSVAEIKDKLKHSILGNLKSECIHGKMKSSEKDKIMNDFKNGDIDILISTTVIEVGVDVPNATVMMIENAERFGLSQLHQLRGRVGRGREKSYCILVSDCKTDNCAERMKIMTETTDGFLISQKDLELRGCGQFFGTRQHGIPELKVANLFSDVDLLEAAQRESDIVMKADPNLESAEYTAVRNRIDKLFRQFDDSDIFN